MWLGPLLAILTAIGAAATMFAAHRAKEDKIP